MYGWKKKDWRERDMPFKTKGKNKTKLYWQLIKQNIRIKHENNKSVDLSLSYTLLRDNKKNGKGKAFSCCSPRRSVMRRATKAKPTRHILYSVRLCCSFVCLSPCFAIFIALCPTSVFYLVCVFVVVRLFMPANVILSIYWAVHA